MGENYEYTRKRMEFGRVPVFDNTEDKALGGIPQNASQRDHYVTLNPMKHLLHNIP